MLRNTSSNPDEGGMATYLSEPNCQVITSAKQIKGSGVWWVFINHQGRRKAKKVGSKKAAKEVAAKIEAKLASRDFDLETTRAPTFGEAVQGLARSNRAGHLQTKHGQGLRGHFEEPRGPGLQLTSG